VRVVREIEILKLRGCAHLHGRHFYEVDRSGIAVYPRIEAVAGAGPAPPATRERVSTGIEQLDTMTCGGFHRSSTTLVLGAAGSAKTLVGLHFLLDGARRGEAGVLLGFYEPPTTLEAVAAAAGLDLARHTKDGTIEIAWHPRREQLVDKVATDVLSRIARTGAKRLFVDSLAGFSRAAMYPGRMPDFFAAMANELHSLGVTTIWSEETHTPQGPDIDIDVENVSAVCDNIVLLRSIDTPRGTHRLVSVRKVRGSDFDSSVHELWVTKDGVRIAPTSDSAVALLERRGVMRTNVPGYGEEPPGGGGLT
jgi:circadian clock protein KaiC